MQTANEQERDVESGATPNGDVAALAYALWQDRGCPMGSPEEDWFRAEAELRDHHAAAAAA